MNRGYARTQKHGLKFIIKNKRKKENKLALEAPITTAADDIHKYFSSFFRENKTVCFM